MRVSNGGWNRPFLPGAIAIVALQILCTIALLHVLTLERV
jgi:hypothetical protein